MIRQYAACALLAIAAVAVCRGDVPDGKGGWVPVHEDFIQGHTPRPNIYNIDDQPRESAPKIEYTADQQAAFVAMFGARKIRTRLDGDDVIAYLPIRVKPGDSVTAYPDGSFRVHQRNR